MPRRRRIQAIREAASPALCLRYSLRVVVVHRVVNTPWDGIPIDLGESVLQRVGHANLDALGLARGRARVVHELKPPFGLADIPVALGVGAPSPIS